MSLPPGPLGASAA